MKDPRSESCDSCCDTIIDYLTIGWLQSHVLFSSCRWLNPTCAFPLRRSVLSPLASCTAIQHPIPSPQATRACLGVFVSQSVHLKRVSKCELDKPFSGCID